MAKSEKVFIGIDDKVIELTGDDKEAFLADRQATTNAYELFETEYKAKQDARDSALKKLAEIAGLTKEELNAIL
jgi:hypothetical protein